MKKLFAGKKFNGHIHIPPSKSHTIRSILFSFLKFGKTVINNPLISDDTKMALSFCSKMGADIIINKYSVIIDSSSLKNTDEVYIDCGNSGTTLFFSTAVSSLFDFKVHFTGDSSLSSRSVKGLLNALKKMGVLISVKSDNSKEWYLPYFIKGKALASDIIINCTTSQFVSALLLIMPLLDGESTLTVSNLCERPYIEMTLSYLKMNNISYYVSEDLTFYRFSGSEKYVKDNYIIPPDMSSALPFYALKVLTSSEIVFDNFFTDRLQADYKAFEVIDSMMKDEKSVFDIGDFPDSLPVLCCTATQAKRPVLFKNVANARIKETDRIKVISENLNILGIKTQQTVDSIKIYPNKTLHGGILDSYNDHRIAMALSVLSALCKGDVYLKNEKCTNVSFPDFWNIMESISY